MTKRIIGVIPARWQSQRLPGKPIADICGLPMIVRVWQNISKSKLINDIFVATDDERIAKVCDEYKITSIMTSNDLISGTDRIEQASKNIDAEIIVNIQCDEPLLKGEHIDAMLEQFIVSNADVGTLIKKIENTEELFNTNSVKVVIDTNNTAIYFSRSPIPFIRDIEQKMWLKYNNYWKHIGIYAYRKQVLEKFVKLPQSKYEALEKLEQLRLLEANYKFLCVETNADLIGVDTPNDLENVIKFINNSLNS